MDGRCVEHAVVPFGEIVEVQELYQRELSVFCVVIRSVEHTTHHFSHSLWRSVDLNGSLDPRAVERHLGVDGRTYGYGRRSLSISRSSILMVVVMCLDSE